MKIYGLQKMTLLDFPEKVAATVFLGGCDFRCPFCHNFELVDGSSEPVMDEDELFAFLKKRQGLLDGVVFTGGEPCLYTGLPDMMKYIRQLGFQIKLDTNGYHPDNLQEILEEGLADYVAMDVKNSIRGYKKTVGLDILDIDRIRRSASIIMELAPDYEFRTTVVREFHNEDSFREIGELIKGAEKYYLQPFTNRDTVPLEGLHAPEPEEMETYRQIAAGYVRSAKIRGME